MKLKQIEEIVTYKIPIWKPALLIILLLLGYFVVPHILDNKRNQPVKQDFFSSTGGFSTIKEQLGTSFQTVIKPYSELAQKEAGKVLGIAQVAVQKKVQDVTLRSTEQAKEFVFDNTIGKVLLNFKSLSKDQQELIKKAICK